MPQARPQLGKPDEKKLLSYTSVYTGKDEIRFEVHFDGKGLSVKFKNRWFNILPESDTKFYTSDYDAQLMFEFIQAEGAQCLIYDKILRACKKL